MSVRPIISSLGFFVLVCWLAISTSDNNLYAGRQKVEEKKPEDKKTDDKKAEDKKPDEPKKDEPKKEETKPVKKAKGKKDKEEVKKDPSPIAEEPVDPTKQAEKILNDAKIKIDAESLKEFFRYRTLNDVDRKKLNDLINKLGDDDFDIREEASDQLQRAGLAALPTLRFATKNKDVETIRRIERCLQTLTQENESGRVISAAHMMAVKKIEGAPKILLDYMPCIPDDEAVQEGLRNALILYTKNVGRPDPLLITALTDKDADRRTLASQVLGESSPDQREAVKKLLQDSSPKVRYFTALTLARGGDKSVIPDLLKLLVDGPLEYAYLTEDLMFQLLGDGKMGTTLTTGDEKSRKASFEAWSKWWKENETKVDLVKLTTGEPIKGLTLVVEVDGFSGPNGGQGRVWECGPDGQKRWEWTNVNGPVDIQVLPGGRYLVGEYYTSQVTERDGEGKILWTSPRLNSNTVACQRLPNGNTLIATMNEVIEVKKDGERVGDVYPRPAGTVYHVRRAKNGHTFILAGNELMELSAERKELRKIPIPGGLSGWGGFDFLPNGNFLIGYYGNGRKYAEINGKGEVVFEHVVNMEPTRVQRLRNGNVLLTGGNSMFVAEYDRDKKEVWKVATKGRPFSVLRY
jgi:hypothetical protein